MAVVCPLPLFDQAEYLTAYPIQPAWYSIFKSADYQIALQFIQCFTSSRGTFNAYRREVERLLQWSWLVQKTSLTALTYQDIEAFITFCQAPPKSWISSKKSPRFVEDKAGTRKPNPSWRPFVVTLPKSETAQGKRPDVNQFALANISVRGMFAILNSFFNFCLQQRVLDVNPVALIRQRSKFICKPPSKQRVRRLSKQQWQTVLDCATHLATTDPSLHERTLFIISCLVSMYLRISELAASERWCPSMNDFQKDSAGRWWFHTLGKGNKERQIAVSDAMLQALTRWRQHLNLSPLPNNADNRPLLPKLKGHGPITSTTYIRRIIQTCFDQAVASLNAQHQAEEAASLQEATVHWLRHTGISEDVKHRPREHVRDDAGHSSSATTDKYIDIELGARHQSAQTKPMLPLDAEPSTDDLN